MFLNELVAFADPKMHMLIRCDLIGLVIMRDSIDVSYDRVDTIAVFKYLLPWYCRDTANTLAFAVFVLFVW